MRALCSASLARPRCTSRRGNRGSVGSADARYVVVRDKWTHSRPMSFFICLSMSSTDCCAFGGGGAGRGGGVGGGGGFAALLLRVLLAAPPLPPLLLPAFAGSSRPVKPISKNSSSSSPTDKPMSASSSAKLLSRVRPPAREARFCARVAQARRDSQQCDSGEPGSAAAPQTHSSPCPGPGKSRPSRKTPPPGRCSCRPSGRTPQSRNRSRRCRRCSRRRCCGPTRTRPLQTPGARISAQHAAAQQRRASLSRLASGGRTARALRGRTAWCTPP